MKKLISITEHTKIELGLIITLLSVSAGGLVFIISAFGKIESHDVELKSIKTEVSEFRSVAEDVSYLRGRFDEKFPPNIKSGNR